MAWTWLIVVVAFGLIVGPLVSLMPSRRQRAIARLRIAAAKLGLRVSLRALSFKNAKESGETFPVYTLVWHGAEEKNLAQQPAWAIVRVKYVHDIHVFKDWDWANQNLKADGKWQQALVNLFEQANTDALFEHLIAIEWTKQGIQIYWYETADIQDVERLAQLLESIKHFAQQKTDTLAWPLLIPAEAD